MLLAGGCCCGDDEPPPPTCAECPKPRLRINYEWRGNSWGFGEEFDVSISLSAVLVFRPSTGTYIRESWTYSGTGRRSGYCGISNGVLDYPANFEGFFGGYGANGIYPCLITLVAGYGGGVFPWTGNGTIYPICCAPNPSTPCFYAFTQELGRFVFGTELPNTSQVIWDGCNAYADDVAIQRIIYDGAGKVVGARSEAASWGATVI